jgi:predicted regulator of Ras-like GTPase activity (Roadblock/LC7/MglB family)
VNDARSLLAAVTSVPGASFAVAMDRGGFVIEWTGETRLDAEDVAALGSCLLENSEGIGREFGQGAVRSMICEFDDGLVLVMGVDSATRLAVVLRDPAALDAVRRCAAQIMPALSRVMTCAG